MFPDSMEPDAALGGASCSGSYLAAVFPLSTPALGVAGAGASEGWVNPGTSSSSRSSSSSGHVAQRLVHGELITPNLLG